MEDKGVYRAHADQVYIRMESLQPFPAWSVPTAAEVRAAMSKAGLEPRELADYVGVSRKEVNRWTTAAGEVPYACWVLLCRRAGLGYVES